MKLGITIAALVALFLGCATTFDPLAYAHDDATCVTSAATRAEADVCRAAVRAKYGLPPRDGGAEVTPDAATDAAQEAGHD